MLLIETLSGYGNDWFVIGVDLPVEALAACIGTKELVAGLPHWLRLRRPDRDTVLYPEISYPTYAMGATRFQTATRVVVPAAFSGIASAYILGISRAVGETMILAVAAGMQPNLSLNPLEPAATITSYIVQVALGDLPHGSVGYQTIFAAGLTLMLMTLMFNMLGYWLRRKYREVY